MRSLTKMLTYRIAVLILLAAVTFYFTGNLGEATAITVVFNVCGSVVYYVYERLWNSIDWGKNGAGPRKSGVGALSSLGAMRTNADPVEASATRSASKEPEPNTG